MLTGDLVRVKTVKQRVVPLYIDRREPHWQETAESLLLLFREGVGRTRAQIEDEIDGLFGEGGKATQVYRGLAKVLEDRSEFEVVAKVPPEVIRERVFTAAAEERKRIREQSEKERRPRFDRERVLAGVARELELEPEALMTGLFADLRDENRLLRFDDMTAVQLVDRYNVALAQAVLLRSVRIEVEIRGERPARYRQIFRWLKFHRLIHHVQGSMSEGYLFHIDGPLSLFAATTKYGLQVARFLPALLLCNDFRLSAELRFGPRREPRSFELSARDGLVSHKADAGMYTPAELTAFVERFRQVAPAWELKESSAIIELGREGVWVPDYQLIHRASGVDVFLEVLGFWKRSSLERLMRLLPKHGPPRYVLAISERLKVDEETLGELAGPILRFKEIPNASDLAALLETFTPRADATPLFS